MITMPNIPKDFPVQPLRPGQEAKARATCGHCGLSWDDGKVTSMTPAPAARCPFEAFHVYQQEPTESAELESHYFGREVAARQSYLLPIDQLTIPVLAEAVLLSIRFREQGGAPQWHTFVVAKVGREHYAVTIGYGYAHTARQLVQKYRLVGGEFFLTPRTE